MFGERIELFSPNRSVARPAMHKHERGISAAFALIVDDGSIGGFDLIGENAAVSSSNAFILFAGNQ
jgi:hypothetical protein